jgi:translation initiation factor 2B subunit (eIF-2B alpha/beta/delta family)
MSVHLEYRDDGTLYRARHHLRPDETIGAHCRHDSGGISISIGTASVFLSADQARKVIANLTEGLRVDDAARPSAEVLREMSDYGRDLMETATALHRVPVAERSA